MQKLTHEIAIYLMLLAACCQAAVAEDTAPSPNECQLHVSVNVRLGTDPEMEKQFRSDLEKAIQNKGYSISKPSEARHMITVNYAPFYRLERMDYYDGRIHRSKPISELSVGQYSILTPQRSKSYRKRKFSKKELPQLLDEAILPCADRVANTAGPIACPDAGLTIVQQTTELFEFLPDAKPIYVSRGWLAAGTLLEIGSHRPLLWESGPLVSDPSFRLYDVVEVGTGRLHWRDTPSFRVRIPVSQVNTLSCI